MYIPLKVTTDYSLLKSLIKIDDLIKFCVQKNIKSCGICDTNLFGVIEFYKKCQENKIKPLIGLEIELNNHKIYLYAQNESGYKNLLKINTIITERNISIMELKMDADNILSIIPLESMEIYDELSFFKNLYIGYRDEVELKNALIKSQKVVYLNDIKCFSKEDLAYLKYLDILREEESNKYYDNYFNFNITSFDEEKLEEVNNLLNVKITLGKRYIPKYNKDIDSLEFLKNLCLKGLQKRLKGNVPRNYFDRLKYELRVINKMGFVDYFLIVYDYVLYAKKNGILVGPGRGSAAGSLVSFVIGITDIDPIKYNLLFERFLNPERVSMPDIDIDFDNTKREEVINYVKNKYGKLNVSGGITFATLKTRLVLREVGGIFKIEDRLLNKFLKVIDGTKNLKGNLTSKDVNAYLKTYPNLKEVYKVSLKLEGLKKNISTHAAGIVIADRPLDEIIPMYKNNDVYLTGVTMEHLEDLGLLKMDFLALKNLSTISNIIKNIESFNLKDIPLDDEKVYDLFKMADTDGIFQFETKAFKNVLVKFKPQNFAELVAAIALVRPGPSRELETYIKRKNGLEKVEYYHEHLKDILKETYGVIIYQEQVMSILVKMASFTYAEADNIRRAMAKKKMQIMENTREEFIKRCVKNGYEISLAQNIFEHILSFASYGFNKAHSVSYAYVSYQMAYLKVHYRALFTFELLESITGSNKIKLYLNELKKYHYQINPVNINISSVRYVLKDKQVYLPFTIIKNFKKDNITKILEERERLGIYKDIFDFFKRTYQMLTKNDYTILIKAGALNDFGYNTKTLINNLDALINYGSLSYDLGEYALIPDILKEEEFTAEELRSNEEAVYDFFLSNHPASKYSENEVMKLEKIKENCFKDIVCYVMIEDVSFIKTKKGEDMGFIRASDETYCCDFTVFPNNFSYMQNLQKNDMIKIWGKVSKRYDKYSIIVNRLVKE